MPGLHVTDRQVRRFMTSRREGHTQAVAAAQAGFSERTGRRVEAGPTLPSQKPPRTYRTRADPFADVWREELVPLLEAVPHIRATSLLEELDRRHPGRFGEGVLRSLQRRVAHWRATEGPERELSFGGDRKGRAQHRGDAAAGDTKTSPGHSIERSNQMTTDNGTYRRFLWIINTWADKLAP